MTPPAVRTGLLLALLGLLVAAALTVDLPDISVLQAQVLALGPLAPVAFVVGYAAIVPLPIPKSILTTVAAVAFGVWPGVPLVVVGATCGAILAFVIARVLGRDTVNRLAGHRLARVDDVIQRHGILAALTVRFVPVLPFTILNYACGVTAMRLRHYALGTALGIVPGNTAIVVLASTGAKISLWVPVLFSATLAVISLSGGLLWRARHNR
jgi:uncharacterized membrane protein YdjX (TVP38/TMEM64 family)